MNDEDFGQSLARVSHAMDQLGALFFTKVELLRQKGVDEDQIKRLTEGARAMKDSGVLYLEWAKYYVSELSKVDGGDSEGTGSFLDEDSDFEGMELR